MIMGGIVTVEAELKQRARTAKARLKPVLIRDS